MNLRKKRQERVNKSESAFNYNPLVQKPTVLNPLGPRSGYHYFGPPPDAGFSYGFFKDSVGNTFVCPKGAEMYSPATGKTMKFIKEAPLATVTKLVKSGVYADLINTCPACSTPLITSSTVDKMKHLYCPTCGENMDESLDEMKDEIINDEDTLDVVEEENENEELNDMEIDLEDISSEEESEEPSEVEEDEDMPFESEEDDIDIELDEPLESEEFPIDDSELPPAEMSTADEMPLQTESEEDGFDFDNIDVIDDVTSEENEELESEEEVVVDEPKVEGEEAPVEAPKVDEQPAEGEVVEPKADEPKVEGEEEVVEPKADESAEGEEEVEPKVESEEEEIAQGVHVETLSNISAYRNLSTDDITMLRYDEGKENPYYVMLAKGQPVAKIELAAQPKPEEIRASFIEDNYANALKDAVAKVGLADVLSHVNAKLYVNKIHSGKLAKKVAEKVKAAMEKKYKAKLANLRKDFLHSLGIVMAGTTKNFFDAGSNPLKAAFWSELNSLGIRKPHKIIESAFDKGANPFFKFVTDKAVEYMDMPREALAEVAKAIGEANTMEVNASEENDFDEKPIREKLQAGNNYLQSGQILASTSDLKSSIKNRLSLNKKVF